MDSYKTIVRWAAQGNAKTCPIEVWEGIIRSWEYASPVQTVYIQAVLDCYGIKGFPAVEIKEAKKKNTKKHHIDDESEEVYEGFATSKVLLTEDDSSGDESVVMRAGKKRKKGTRSKKTVAKSGGRKRPMCIRVDSYYRIETIEECDTEQTETSIFRVNNVREQGGETTSADVTWLYTYEQMKKLCECKGYSDEMPEAPIIDNALYVSTHIQVRLHITEDVECVDHLIRSVPIENDQYWIAGVYHVQEPMKIWKLQCRAEKDAHRVRDIASHLLSRGSQTTKSVEMMRTVFMRVKNWENLNLDISYKGTCDGCKLVRNITHHVQLGKKRYYFGQDCYDHVELAHRMLHHKTGDKSIQELFDLYEGILTTTLMRYANNPEEVQV